MINPLPRLNQLWTIFSFTFALVDILLNYNFSQGSFYLYSKGPGSLLQVCLKLNQGAPQLDRFTGHPILKYTNLF